MGARESWGIYVVLGRLLYLALRQGLRISFLGLAMLMS
jgi:hypothetical protein